MRLDGSEVAVAAVLLSGPAALMGAAVVVATVVGLAANEFDVVRQASAASAGNGWTEMPKWMYESGVDGVDGIGSGGGVGNDGWWCSKSFSITSLR